MLGLADMVVRNVNWRHFVYSGFGSSVFSFLW